MPTTSSFFFVSLYDRSLNPNKFSNQFAIRHSMLKCLVHTRRPSPSHTVHIGRCVRFHDLDPSTLPGTDRDDSGGRSCCLCPEARFRLRYQVEHTTVIVSLGAAGRLSLHRRGKARAPWSMPIAAPTIDAVVSLSLVSLTARTMAASGSASCCARM